MELSRVIKSLETESKSGGYQEQAGEKNEALLFNRYRFQFYQNKSSGERCDDDRKTSMNAPNSAEPALKKRLSW